MKVALDFSYEIAERQFGVCSVLLRCLFGKTGHFPNKHRTYTEERPNKLLLKSHYFDCYL